MMPQEKLLRVRFGPKALLKRAGKNDGTSKKLKDSKINSMIHISSPLINVRRKVSDKPMLNKANEMQRPGDGNSTKTKNGRKNRPKSNGQKNNSVGNDSNKRKKRSTRIGALIRHRKRRDAKKSGISTVRTNTVNTSNNKRKSKRNMRDAWRRPVSTGKPKSRKCGRTIPAWNKNSKIL